MNIPDKIDELRLTRQKAGQVVYSRDVFGGELAGDDAMLRWTVHGKVACGMRIADMTDLFKGVKSGIAFARRCFRFHFDT